MNRNQIWRVVACSTDTYQEHDEVHVTISRRFRMNLPAHYPAAAVEQLP